jgi:hypothetical protein
VCLLLFGRIRVIYSTVHFLIFNLLSLHILFSFIPSDDYRSHTSCVTEAERYEKSVYRGPRKNETGHRKLTPQESWMETIRSSLNNPIPSNIQGYIQQLSNMENAPRKENAFINFAINSLRLRGDHGRQTASTIWNHLSQVRMEQQSKNNKTVETTKIQVEVEEEVERVHESPKPAAASESAMQNNNNNNLKASVEKIMKKILKKQSPDHRLPFKQLKKKIKNKLRVKKIECNKGDLKKNIIQSSMVKQEGKDILLLV